MSSRSHLMLIIDGLSPKQLAGLGQQIKTLPTPPIVTLVTTIPVLNGKEQSEEKKAQAKQGLATAKEILNIHAAGAVVPGSNPMISKDFFMNGKFDAMIKRMKNGQLAIFVKNFSAMGIKELTSTMPVEDVSSKSLHHSHAGAFFKPQSPAAPTPLVAECKPKQTSNNGLTGFSL